MSASGDDRVPANAARCAACDARLAHDQRYCLDCGARRGPLPPHVAELSAGRFERGRPLLGAESGPAAGLSATKSLVPFASLVLTPRSAAVAVLGMLAFGVAVGSVVGRGAARLASAPLLILEPWRAPPVATGGVGRTTDLAASSPLAPGSPVALARTITIGGTQTPSTAPSSSPTGGGSGPSNRSSNPLGLPPIKHVFLIVLSDHGYSQTFAQGSPDRYLSRTLARKGELLPFYFAVTAGSLANEIALISGQGPTPQTAANCPRFAAIRPATKASRGQVLGGGCVYPAHTQTLAGQLSAAGDRWRAYVQGVGGNGRTGCRYPRLGATDDRAPSPHRPYVTYRNPFVYFRSVTAQAGCAKNEVGLGKLADDLRSSSTTPAFSYIVADPCHDGSQHSCGGHAPSGLAAADTFLRSVVSKIEHSAAFKADGLIAITFDEAPQAGPHADHSSCCNNPRFPNLSPASESASKTAAMTAIADTAGVGSGTTPSAVATTSTSTDTTTTSTTSTTTGTSTSSTTTTTTTPATSTTPATTTTTPATSTTPATTSTPPTPAIPTTTSTPPAATTSITTAPGPTSTPSSTPTTPPTTTTPGSATGETSPSGGGGQVGMLLLSPYVKAGSTDVTSYFNHFSLLKTVEAVFGLRYLGYAREIAIPAFDSSVFSAAG